MSSSNDTHWHFVIFSVMFKEVKGHNIDFWWDYVSHDQAPLETIVFKCTQEPKPWVPNWFGSYITAETV